MNNEYTAQTGDSTAIQGSPFTVEIIPGEVDPLQSFTDLAGAPTLLAGTAHDFTITFVDLWGNIHTDAMADETAAGMTVSLVADYVNHDNYPSPIGVADLTDWQTIYGTSITGTTTDNGDGTMTGSVTIERAGTYTLTVQIDDSDVIGSPFEFIEVTPSSLSAPNCVPLDIPLTMSAGFDYSF